MGVSRRVLVGATLGVVAAGLLLASRGRERDGGYVTAALDRGDIVETVGATGTLQAVTTVQVGSQVSGTIASLGADFNSRVKKGQVVARLDPSLFEARVSQAQANLLAARANVDKARSAAEDASRKYERSQELAAQQLVSDNDLETARTTHDGAVAQLKAADSAVAQAEASLHQAEVDLAHTVIAAPIDGVVIARNVDVGQTVAASFQAPVLFVIANDLTRMQVNAAIDEADIGRVRVGQDVDFRVDSYPERSFSGRVEQIRLQPATVQNVVTYNTIIAVDNEHERLMPGMTATVSVIVKRADNALRLPAAALRFRPEGASEPPAAAQAAGRSGGASAAPAREAGAPGERRALVFVLGEKGTPRPARIRVGLSDGQFVEVMDGLPDAATVILGTGTGTPGAATRPSGAASANPFAPRFQPRRR